MQDEPKGEFTPREANMAETVSSAEAALENQRIGGVQLRVAAPCTLVQICDGYDLNSIAWAGPSPFKGWHPPPAGIHPGIRLFGGRHPGRCAFRGPDRRPFRPSATAAGKSDDLWGCLTAQRHG